jgi:hypothetical protein
MTELHWTEFCIIAILTQEILKGKQCHSKWRLFNQCNHNFMLTAHLSTQNFDSCSLSNSLTRHDSSSSQFPCPQQSLPLTITLFDA